jgi:hypothetical protein
MRVMGHVWGRTQPVCIERDEGEGGVVRFLIHEFNKPKGERVIYGA